MKKVISLIMVVLMLTMPMVASAENLFDRVLIPQAASTRGSGTSTMIGQWHISAGVTRGTNSSSVGYAYAWTNITWMGYPSNPTDLCYTQTAAVVTYNDGSQVYDNSDYYSGSTNCQAIDNTAVGKTVTLAQGAHLAESIGESWTAVTTQ